MTFSKSFVLCFAFAFLGSHLSYCYDYSKLDTWKILSQATTTIDDDVWGIVAAPFRQPRVFAGYSLGLMGLVATDRATTQFLQDEVYPKLSWGRGSSDLFIVPHLTTQDVYILSANALAFVGASLIENRRLQAAAVLTYKSALYSYFFSHLVLKPLFGRSRPVSNLRGSGAFTERPGFGNDPFDWFHFPSPSLKSGTPYTGFPSFHLTWYFAAASTYAQVYDVYWLPFSLAIGASFWEAEEHLHWFSDMVAGALIGWGIGKTLVGNFEKDEATQLENAYNWKIVPLVSFQSEFVGFTSSVAF